MPDPEYDPILVRCPLCKNRWFQPDKPIASEFAAVVIEEKLASEHPNHTLPEVIEESATQC
jgi:hypothetical protein